MRFLRVVAAAPGLMALATIAMAAKVGDSLYIKAKNTKLMSSPSPTADVVKVLQPGDEVTWMGADKAVKRWHKVKVSGKQGLVFQSNLTPEKPKLEMTSAAGGKVDPRAFASSGAATKALGEGAKEYGKNKDMGEAVAELEALEALAKEVTDKDVTAHVSKAGLFPVVGDRHE